MLTVPLQARLRSAGRSYVITEQLLDDVRMGSTIPGGYSTCDLTVARSLSLQPEQFDAFSLLDIIDTRTAMTVWSGRLDVPGRQAGDRGQTFQLTGTGAQASTTDLTLPVVYNDARLGPWQHTEQQVTPDATFGSVDIAGSGQEPADRLRAAFPRGTVLGTNARAVGRYELLTQTLQRLARLEVGVTGARALAMLRAQLVGRGGGVPGASADTVTADVPLTTSEQILLVSGLAAAHYAADLRLLWTGDPATLINDDVTSFLARGIRVQGERVNADGSTVTTYPAPEIPTAALVADVVGRFLPQIDGVTAVIAASAAPVTQLAYEDGTTARQVLEDLMGLDSGYFWAAWEYGSNLRARFEWAPYPTTVGLDVDARDGFSIPGSAVDLFDEVSVRWVDMAGRKRHTLRTGDSPALTAAGVTRRDRLDLGAQAGDLAQAQRAGDAFLEQARQPSNNGQLRISRPVADRVSGRTLQPWEIRAGGLVRVRDIAPRLDALNPGGSDAVTVFRVAEVSYSSSDNTAVLTLDAFSWQLERQIAGLAKQAARQLRP